MDKTDRMDKTDLTKLDKTWQNLTKLDKTWQNLTKLDKTWQNLNSVESSLVQAEREPHFPGFIDDNAKADLFHFDEHFDFDFVWKGQKVSHQPYVDVVRFVHAA